MAQFAAQPPPHEFLWDIFQKVDKDRSGHISATELQTALSNGTWSPFNPETVRLMIEALSELRAIVARLQPRGVSVHLYRDCGTYSHNGTAPSRGNSPALTSTVPRTRWILVDREGWNGDRKGGIMDQWTGKGGIVTSKYDTWNHGYWWTGKAGAVIGTMESWTFPSALLPSTGKRTVPVKRNGSIIVTGTIGTVPGMFDKHKQGTIGFEDFGALWRYVTEWQNCFRSFDKDNSGSIDRNELTTALSTFGYRLAAPTVETIMKKYDRFGKGTILFDDFIQCSIQLHTLTDSFRKYDTDQDGVITLQYEQFVDMVFSIKS